MAAREERTLSAPTVMLDGKRLKVIPNSVTHEFPGTAEVRAVSAGGTAVEMVYGIDITEYRCSVKFDLPATAEYSELARDYAARRDGEERSTIRIVEDTDQVVYDQCTLVNKMELAREPEGKISFEFVGRFNDA